IYSLGATFYFLLTGRTPFGEGSVAQKLLWHANKRPRPIAEFRNDVPPELSAIIFKMMAKLPADRHQSPAEVAEALDPFTQTPIPPPPEAEMPQLSLAAIGYATPDPMTSVSKHTPGFRPAATREPASAGSAPSGTSAASTIRELRLLQGTPSPGSGATAVPI